MAEIIGGGEPVNDGERAVIRHLRDHGPDHWVVLHNFELALRGGRKYEIDILVVTEFAVTLIDVKGTRGRIEVAGGRWYPARREPFRSPVDKLRAHARALKGRLQDQGVNSGVYVDALVVLPAPSARLIDRDTSPDADAAKTVEGLDDLIPKLSRVDQVRPGSLRDISRHRTAIVTAITGVVSRRTGSLRFSHWEVTESLGETAEVTEYRARNTIAEGAAGALVRLRVYHADPLQDEAVRAAERNAISNAYTTLARVPPDPCIVGVRDFFSNEDESQYILVLDDVRASALYLHLTDPRRALTADGKQRVITGLLRGLSTAHAHRVLHRALSPATVLVTGTGDATLTGFDYARPEGPRPRGMTVADRLRDILDPAYVAPECQSQPERMSRASDVYAAGVIAFQVLTGELPFATTAEQHRRSSDLPVGPMAAAGVPGPVIDLLRRMCALEPGSRPTAARALEEYTQATAAPPPKREEPGTDYRNLPEGHQLTRKYTVQRKIGSGSFGAVYQVYDNLAGAARALKIVDRDRESLVGRLQQEYRTLLSLDPHPNVVTVESADYLEGRDVPYLVFEYLDGKDVGDLVRDRTLGPADAIRLGVDGATGLAFLHANGVYHCDIKPSNLLWTDSGCKIIDFNVAVTAESSLSRAGGSVRYVPPDANRSATPTFTDLTDRDVYALGVTLYQVLTGRYPFASNVPALGERAVDPREIPGLRDLSDEVVGVVLRAIEPLRGDRFASAADFLAALKAITDVRRAPEPAPGPVLPVPVPSQPDPNVNPFVGHLMSLYSQSRASNAGTRGADSYGTYVTTALDDRLIPDVLSGKFRLVVVTGNAGDGKTAFLERLVATARERGGRAGAPRPNGTDITLPGGLVLRTNNDGSQDEGDRSNDEVLAGFFGPFADAAEPDAAETRLIAINEGRLVDFLAARPREYAALRETVEAGLAGQPPAGSTAVINLNQRSLVAPGDAGPVFDRVLGELTHDRFWKACESCELAKTCYAPHNARTFAHPAAGPKITARLRDLYRLVHLRGQFHITVRDLRSALAYTLTSGRDCDEIHDLYARGDRRQILDGFYFNSWLGADGTADRLLRLLRELDIAAAPEPSLDGRLAALGPAAGQAMMTIDRRGHYDRDLLEADFRDLRQSPPAEPDGQGPAAGYLGAARRRFYFECIDEAKARSALPFRSAQRFLGWLASPGDLDARLPEVVEAINRGEGLPSAALSGGNLALAIRDVPGGTIRSYRMFPRDALALTVAGAPGTPYVEGEPDGLELAATGAGGHVARLRVRLDLFELLQRQREGYLPSVAELQGRYLDLLIFKNELSATPYQEIVLTSDGRDAHRIRREPGGRLVMTSLTGNGEDGDEEA